MAPTKRETPVTTVDRIMVFILLILRGWRGARRDWGTHLTGSVRARFAR